MISVATSAFVHETTLATLGEPGEIPYGWERDGKVGGPRPTDTLVEIMPKAVVREYVTVQRPIVAGGTTRIGAGAMVMSHAHIAHDCDVGEDAVIATGAILGGHTRVGVRGYVGLGAVTHQHTTLGEGCMVGMHATVTGDVPPFAKVIGSPARIIGVNRVGMERAGFTEEEIQNANALLCWPEDSILVEPRIKGAWRSFRDTSKRPWAKWKEGA